MYLESFTTSSELRGPVEAGDSMKAWVFWGGWKRHSGNSGLVVLHGSVFPKPIEVLKTFEASKTILNPKHSCIPHLPKLHLST